VWLALKHVGAAGYRRLIAADIGLASALADAIRGQRELEVLTRR
jgi:glutamate/tyrosine decarboxylase-like PLP-dependent enzyme